MGWMSNFISSWPWRRRAPCHFSGGYDHAARLLITAGGIPERLRSEAAFAALCAASPIPVSSGKANRHRLNRAGGDRDANRALCVIIVHRLRSCSDTQAYIKRRIAEGVTKPEAIRCVKRYVAQQTHHAVGTDLPPQANDDP